MSARMIAMEMAIRLLIPFCFCIHANASPQIAFTSVPPYGSSDVLRGQVSDAQLNSYQVALLINVSGLGWWSKPYCNASFTQAFAVPILSGGSWSTPYVTGGVDDTATQMAVFLVPATSVIPCYLGVDGIPTAIRAQAVASALINRPYPRQVSFGGLIFNVKTNRVPIGPGPCLFSDSTDNVWVDDQGQLHLKITNRNGQWYCAEVVSQAVVGFGPYRFSIGSSASNLDPNVVLGLFTWSDDDASYSHREIDIEYSRFAQPTDPTNGQFVIQPGQPQRFTFPPGSSSVNTFDWESDHVLFTAKTVAGATVAQWNGTQGVPPAGNVNLRLNLWLFNSTPPAAETEVIIGGLVTPPKTTTVDVIEFYNTSQDHYFISSLQPDIGALDSGRFPGWVRTGLTFNAFPQAASGASPVCRFYIPPSYGDSHFYSASPAECAQTAVRFPSLILESPNVMYMDLPDALTGACPAGDVPVYRVWDNRADSNHRYTTDPAIRAQMVTNGWVVEGYGPNAVIMCAPSSPLLAVGQ